MKQMGPEFVSDCVDLLYRSLSSKKPPRCHCYVHGADCRVLVRPQSEAPHNADAISLNITGFSCASWSSMGNQLGWLDETSLPWSQWCAERLKRQDDWVVCECTGLFDLETFREIAREVYEVHSLFVSPDMLGEPIRRNRMYMLLIHKARWKFCESVEAQSVQDAFEHIFMMNVVQPVTGKFRADPSDVRSFMMDLISKQNMPATSRSGRPWSYIQACSSAQRMSVQEHTAWLEPYTDWVANLSQRASHMPPTPHVPALLKNSWLYAFSTSSTHRTFRAAGLESVWRCRSGPFPRCKDSDEEHEPDPAASHKW